MNAFEVGLDLILAGLQLRFQTTSRPVGSTADRHPLIWMSLRGERSSSGSPLAADVGVSCPFRCREYKMAKEDEAPVTRELYCASTSQEWTSVAATAGGDDAGID